MMTRHDAIKHLANRIIYCKTTGESKADGVNVDALEMATIALQEPKQKKGNWIKAYPTNPEVWMCSECHYIDEPKWSYCRNCGAEMKGENDGEDNS
jgi:hypothetical protein